MLGIFDSGFGGLTILKHIHTRLPQLTTVYLGDNARAPYGTRSQEDIFTYTLSGVRFLFSQGCPLVILACNTASAQALRRIQTEILPKEFPDRRVLGVIRPSCEYLASQKGRIGIFATPSTVASQAYIHELYNLHPTLKVTQIACDGLVDIIERGQHRTTEGKKLVETCVQRLLTSDHQIQNVLLGCTHYPLMFDQFQQTLPDTIHLITQGELVAESLADYLYRHDEIESRIEKKGQHTYFTTSQTEISSLASQFYGSPLEFKNITLS